MQGVNTLSDYIELDKREWGYGYTTISEICFEEHAGNQYARFRFTKYKTSGLQGKEKKTFSWPVSDINNPVEINKIFETILEANSGSIEFNDPRGWFARTFHNVFGIKFINSRDRFVEHDHFDSTCWLSFEIVKEKHDDIIVTLKHLKGKNRQIWAIIPIESIAKIYEWTKPE